MYTGKRALVTGGLGFVGSNLAIRLARLGAGVTIVDPCIKGCGGNPYNVRPVRDRVSIVSLDIADAEQFAGAIAESDVIFNLAGEVSHVHSMQYPERDLQLNTVSHLRFLETVKRIKPGIRVIYASTRQVYGAPDYLPVDESHPVHPVDFNGIHKYAAAMYHLMLSERGEIDGIALRLTNVYGPRVALSAPCQGFLSHFVRRLTLGQGLEIYGDGEQLRDPVYVDDVVEAFLLAGSLREPQSRVFNVGGPEVLSLNRIAGIACRLAAGVEVCHRPFPESQRTIDIGSYASDSSRIRRELGWQPKVRFEEGMARTLEYYRAEWPHYLDPDDLEPRCQLPEHRGVVRRLRYAAV
ncbi:MAG: NAD-dependent epimerase/dehydratase family protein [Bryobacterales bacterium]|nr:NAD-dependent epimerase/dehydratase family protein [Bryobacterales bacterium]